MSDRQQHGHRDKIAGTVRSTQDEAAAKCDQTSPLPAFDAASAPATFYVYSVSVLDYETNSTDHPTAYTLRAFESFNAATLYARGWWHDHRAGEYGAPAIADERPLRVEYGGYYALRSRREQYLGPLERYRQQEVKVSKVWLEVRKDSLPSVAEKKALMARVKSESRLGEGGCAVDGAAAGIETGDIADATGWEVQTSSGGAERAQDDFAEKRRGQESWLRINDAQAKPLHKAVQRLRQMGL